MGTKNNPGAFDCYEHAEPDEPYFTLLARDVVAPLIVEAWADARIRRLLDRADEYATVSDVLAEREQIDEARRVAAEMREWREKNR